MSVLDIQCGFHSKQGFNSSYHNPKMNCLISVPGNNGIVSPCASSVKAESALKFWHGKPTAQVAKSQLPSSAFSYTCVFQEGKNSV